MNNLLIKVLLVEDDKDDYLITKDLLSQIEGKSFSLEWVQTYDAAIETIASNDYDIILIDYRLGDRTGLELLETITQKGYQIPMILLTGQGGYNVDTEAMKAGASDYLVKNYLNSQLLERSIRYAIDRKNSEEALRQSEERFRLLVEGVKDYAIIMLDPQGYIISWNPGAQYVHGYKAEQILNRHFSCFYLEEDIALGKPEQNLKRAIAEGKIEDEGWRVREDGLRFWANVALAALIDENGELRGFCKVTRDMTERKCQEEWLRLYESVVINANDAVVITEAEPTDLPGPRILYVNAAFTRITGYTLQEVQGKTPRILQGPKTDRAVLDKVRSALKAWQPVLVELINYRKDGTEFCTEISIVPVMDETGWYTHWIAIQRDITERKQAENEIRRALEKEKELRELKSRFVSMASHEFRTPLATILAASDLLKRFSYKLSDENKQERLHKIQVEVHNLTRLLDDVLIIGKADAGKLEFKPEIFDLEEFCLNILEEIKISITAKHNLIFNYEVGYKNVEMDGRLLKQIITNLLLNAVKYCPKGGTIDFTITGKKGRIIFIIKDDGIGIPDADRKHLFEPFHRASNVGNISGTGLGLTIIKNAVDLHKGSIAVKSKVGAGTAFFVCLPTSQTTQAKEKIK